jgi:hypothetical protein
MKAQDLENKIRPKSSFSNYGAPYATTHYYHLVSTDWGNSADQFSKQIRPGRS